MSSYLSQLNLLHKTIRPPSTDLSYVHMNEVEKSMGLVIIGEKGNGIIMSKRFLINALWLMLLAAFVYSFADLLLKYLSSSFSATEIAFIRFLIGGLVLWPILTSRRIPLRGNQTFTLILRGLCGTLSFFCLLRSIAMIPLANTIVLLYTFPLFSLEPPLKRGS